jgi:hypothetical protein
MSVLQYCYSSGSQNTLRLASALAANYSDPAILKEKCRALWPDCDIYCGSTHFRVTVANQCKETSFYFDMVPDDTNKNYPEHKPAFMVLHERTTAAEHNKYPKGRNP